MTFPIHASVYDAVQDFGWLYDQVPAYIARDDVAFYLGEASRAAGAVLDLGCGSGRLLLPLLRAGHAVTGVDASPSMLARCRSKLALEPPGVRARATVLECDIRDLAIPGLRTATGPLGDAGGFALAIAPFRILQHLITTEDQLRCLASVRRQLALDGRLVFDVFNPHVASMVTDRSAEAEDTPELALPDGRHFRRTARVLRVRWTEQVSEVELIYYLRTGGTVERTVQRFDMRWYQASELEHLLARAGFAIDEVFGDFARAPLRDESPEIVVVARVQRS